MSTIHKTIITLSRKQVKAQLHLSDYRLKQLLQDAGCTYILERPAQRIFPVNKWISFFEYYGVTIDEFAQ